MKDKKNMVSKSEREPMSLERLTFGNTNEVYTINVVTSILLPVLYFPPTLFIMKISFWYSCNYVSDKTARVEVGVWDGYNYDATIIIVLS